MDSERIQRGCAKDLKVFKEDPQRIHAGSECGSTPTLKGSASVLSGFGADSKGYSEDLMCSTKILGGYAKDSKGIERTFKRIQRGF